MPALPLDDAGPYVAAAYLVFLALVLIYVAIMGVRFSRMSRDIAELSEIVDKLDAGEPAVAPPREPVASAKEPQ